MTQGRPLGQGGEGWGGARGLSPFNIMLNLMLYLCPIHTPSVPRPCPDIPLTADTLSISRLRKKGVMIRFMLKNPVMLDVALPAASGIKAAELKNDMMSLAKNIIWLNLSSNNFTDGD